jgi:HEAT repeat protein
MVYRYGVWKCPSCGWPQVKGDPISEKKEYMEHTLSEGKILESKAINGDIESIQSVILFLTSENSRDVRIAKKVLVLSKLYSISILVNLYFEFIGNLEKEKFRLEVLDVLSQCGFFSEPETYKNFFRKEISERDLLKIFSIQTENKIPIPIDFLINLYHESSLGIKRIIVNNMDFVDKDTALDLMLDLLEKGKSDEEKIGIIQCLSKYENLDNKRKARIFPHLSGLLNASFELRLLSIEILGKLKIYGSSDDLINFYKRSNTSHEQDVILKSLQQLDITPSIEITEKKLSHSDQNIRKIAITSLSNSKNQKAIEILIHIMQKPISSIDLLCAFEAAAKNGNPQFTPLIKKFFKDADSDPKVPVVENLLVMEGGYLEKLRAKAGEGNDSAINSLIDFVFDTPSVVKNSAINNISQCPSCREKFFNMISQKKIPSTRAQMIPIVGYLGDKRGVYLLVSWYWEGDQKQKDQILKALGNIDNETSAQQIELLWKKGEFNSNIIISVLNGMKNHKSKTIINDIITKDRRKKR